LAAGEQQVSHFGTALRDPGNRPRSGFKRSGSRMIAGLYCIFSAAGVKFILLIKNQEGHKYGQKV
jgi:hypothetical protein